MSYGYGNCGYGYEQNYCGFDYGYSQPGGGFALIVVLFILLIIVGAAFYR